MSISGEKRKSKGTIITCRHTAPAILSVAGVAAKESINAAVIV